MGEPTRSRPATFYVDPNLPAPLPWRWATARLESARNYWLVTTRADGSPRARPIWGVWLDDVFYFDSASSDERLRADPRVEIHLESGDEVLILMGTAEPVSDDERRARFLAAYNPKYNWNWEPPAPPALFAVAPKRAIAWVSDPTGLDGGSIFATTATRWTFDGD